MLSLSLALSALAIGASAGPLKPRDDVTAVVNFANNTGTPQHLAAGTLYGLPNATYQIPSHFFTDMDWNYERAGGAQIPSPGLGWIWGVDEYEVRFSTVLDNYRTARTYDANFIFLIHDLWGADGTQNSSAPYPGDNGDWTSWDEYLSYVFSNMTTYGMTEAMIIDLWNEPDSTYFWNRTQEQYLEMWGRTYYKFREQFGTEVLLSGPASAGEPLDNTWWEAWCAFVSSNDSMPDQYAWHMESGEGDLLSAHAGFIGYIEEYDMILNPININEYAIYAEQVPAGSAWWISQLERIDAHGLRGNWLSGYELHDFMASLLGKPGAETDYIPTEAGYWPNGDYQVYKYYAQNMTGDRYGTTPSGDLKLDCYATVDTDQGIARVLVGVRIEEGTWELELANLTSLGLADSGSVDVQTWGFPVNSTDEHFGEVDGPTNLGVVSHNYSGNSVTFPIYQVDETTAYAFEFAIGS